MGRKRRGTRLLAAIAFSAISPAQTALPLSGDVTGTHDPSVIKQGNTWHVFATGRAPGGGQLPIRCSDDLKLWHFCGQVFAEIPAWIRAASPGTKDLWAPDISFHDGVYRLYYAYSLFGKNTSGIGLATNTTLDPKDPAYQWADKGLVLRSTEANDYNAIDPNFAVDAGGNRWLAFGSFWSGIKLRRLDVEGKASAEDSTVYSLASRVEPLHAVEAPFIVQHDGRYYLFVSWDLCCRGTHSTYRTMVGRATRISGPYLDETGKPMTEGGGSELLSGNAAWIGPGGGSVLVGSKERDIFAFHAYDAVTGKPALQISTIEWSNGWPHVALRTENSKHD